MKNYYDDLHENILSDSGSYLHKPALPPEVIQHVMQDVSINDKILELGTGGGHLSSFFSNKAYTQIFSGDVSMVALKYASIRDPSLKLICLDAEKIPIKDNTFNTVVSVEMIEHLSSVPNHLKEVNRILKRGGVYAIKTPNKWIDKFYYRFLLKIDVSKAHVSLCSVSDLKRLLKENGFSVIFVKQIELTESQIKKIYLVLPNFIGSFFVRCVNQILKYFPPQFNLSLICIASKE